MMRALLAGLLLPLAAAGGCGDGGAVGSTDAACPADGAPAPDAPPGDGAAPATLDELVDAYEDGAISRDDFRAGVAAFPDGDLPCELMGAITTTTLMSARTEPYQIVGDLEVAAGAVLVIEEGAVLELADGVDVTIHGRLYAIGSAAAPVVIRAAAGARYDTWFLYGGPNQLVEVSLSGGTRNLYVGHPFETRTLVERGRFDSWSSLAIGQVESSNLHVNRCEFGLATPLGAEAGETIRSRSAGVIVVEDSVFGPRRGYSDVIDLQDCVAGHWPILIGNRFEGGEDDAIDLDGCSAFVIGNHIRNFRPVDLAVQVAGVNGGGVTGDQAGSRPFIANNVIEGCFHAIGFKDGARPIIVNNTILDSNIGITLYQSAVGRPMPQGIAINNLLWNNVGWLDGAANDIVLHGKWWAGYNQVDDVQGTVDARYNLTGTLAAPYAGEGNLTGDPLFEPGADAPVPGPGSPARDSGLGMLELADLPLAQALDLLATDYLGTPRPRDGATFLAIDRGAIEASP